MKTRIVQFIAVLAVMLCFGATTLEAAIIKGYLIVHNDTKVTVTVELDGTTKGDIEPGSHLSLREGHCRARGAKTSSQAD